MRCCWSATFSDAKSWIHVIERKLEVPHAPPDVESLYFCGSVTTYFAIKILMWIKYLVCFFGGFLMVCFLSTVRHTFGCSFVTVWWSISRHPFKNDFFFIHKSAAGQRAAFDIAQTVQSVFCCNRHRKQRFELHLQGFALIDTRAYFHTCGVSDFVDPSY